MNTKEQILATAGELFAQNGYASTSIREICKKLDCNISSINYHFGSKHQLYVCVCEYSSQKMEEIVTQVLSQEVSPSEMLEALFSESLGKSRLVTNGFRMFLNQHLSQEELASLCSECGPPGLSQLSDYLQAHFRELIKERADWIARILLDQLYLKSMVVEALGGEHLASMGYTVDDVKSDWISLGEALLPGCK